MKNIAIAVTLFVPILEAQVDWSPGPSRTTLSVLGVHGAIDTARAQPVLCGGSLSRWEGTWEWNGLLWLKRSSPASPSAREAFSISSDVAGRGIIIFGGSTPNGLVNETWTWNGTDWAMRHPAHAPPASWLPGPMCLDPLRNQVVLLNRSETWLWDGSDWSRAQPLVTPTAARSAMAFDPTSSRVLLFAFSGSGTGETWTWDGQSWTRLTPLNSPSQRFDAALALDPGTNHLLLHGGRDVGVSFEDTWEWDGSTWNQVASDGPPYSGLAALVGDPLRATLLLVRDGPDDAWEWNGSGWHSLGSTVPSPAGNAYGRALEYDPVRSSTICFGGGVFQAWVRNETWEWSGTAWSQRHPATSPPARMFASLASETAVGRLLLFGGADVSARSLGDTWAWNGSDWRQLLPSSPPAARNRHSAAYDPKRRRVVLFGGVQDTTLLGDTWEWDGSQWAVSLPAFSPSARRGQAMAWHGGRERIILFGGGDLSTGFLNDTWEWDGTVWVQLQTSLAPSPRRSMSMTYDLSRDRIVLFGGLGPGDLELGDVWEFDGTDWRQRTTSTLPPPRYFAALAYDSVRREVLTFGGAVGNQVLADTWTLHPLHSANFGPIGSGCAGTAGTPSLAVAPRSLPWMGRDFRLSVENLPPSNSAFLMLLGVSSTSWLGSALPMDLTAIGMPGCALRVGIDWTMPGSANMGTGSWSLVIPVDPSLLGASFFSQALVIDPAANPFGAVLSNAGRATIGGL